MTGRTGLVAGRLAFRLSLLASAPALLAVWDPATFARYAAALGATSWLIIAAGGVEKAVLALVPRRGGEMLTPRLLRFVLVPYLACVAVLAVVRVPLAGAAAYSAGVGALFVLLAVLRVRGRPAADPVSVTAVAAALLLAAPLAHGLALGPSGVLVFLAMTVLGAVAVVFRRVSVTRPAARVAPGAAVVPDNAPLLMTVLQMSAFEVCFAIGVAAAYGMLAGSVWQVDAGVVYLGLLVSQVLIGLVVYLTRLAGPNAARRAERLGPATAFGAARRVLGRTAIATSGCVLLAAPAAVLLGHRPGRWVVFALLNIAGNLLMAAVLYGMYLVEYADRRGRRISAVGALVSLPVLCGAAAPLIPLAGGNGMLIAMLAAQAAQSTTVWAQLR